MAGKYVNVPTMHGPFASLDLYARAVFGLIWNRWQLSQTAHENGSERFMQKRRVRICDAFPDRFPDDQSLITIGFTYCVYTQTELAAEIGCSERTVRRCIDDLLRSGVIEAERAGVRGANRYFIPNTIQRYFNPPSLPLSSDR